MQTVCLPLLKCVYILLPLYSGQTDLLAAILTFRFSAWSPVRPAHLRGFSCSLEPAFQSHIR